jgi:putative molybdopterin biosynthesis protein
MGEKHKAEPSSNIENRLRVIRIAKGLSQAELAGMIGITRQAVCAIEGDQYLPTTAVALRLAGALGCRVEDLFNLISAGDLVEGDLIAASDPAPSSNARVRVKVARVGNRLVAHPVAALGETLAFTVPADGVIVRPLGTTRRTTISGRAVQIRLLRDRRVVEQEIAVAGCEPAIFLAGEHLRRYKDQATVVGYSMGSTAALEALKRGEVHVAGLHIVDPSSGESNLPFLRQHVRPEEFAVITFASWEEGLLVQARNPKSIRDVSDLARPDVRLVNREPGAGARMLLDQKLQQAGIMPSQVQGYGHAVGSHFQIGRHIAEGQADVGMGVRAAAQFFGLDFLPLQAARYDLVVPKIFLKEHPSIQKLIDAIVSRPFRTEIELLGGYDTSLSGRMWNLESAVSH